MTVHLVDRIERSGRRIGDRPGSRTQLCGAAPTAYDMPLRDVRKRLASFALFCESQGRVLCNECIRRAKERGAC